MQPSVPQPGQKIDQELNAIKESVNDTIDRLGEIQRDDGKLKSTALDTTEFNSIVSSATATAQGAATSASSSASQASASASSALTSKNDAQGFALNASGYSVNAATYAASALSSKTSAELAASQAASSASSFGLTIGTTSTGIPGSNGLVNISGSGPSYILNFTVPQGPVGSTGATGAAGVAGQTGPVGPVGPAGQVGQQGIQGPQGPQGINGDKYLTTSVSSLSVTNGTKNITVEQGLSYSTQQNVVVAYDAAHHMHGSVTSYNSITGLMVVSVHRHTGSGTYSSWTINLEGAAGIQGPQGIQGIQGPAGVAGDAGLPGSIGATGATGPQGPAGVGVPTGGVAGQVLKKNSSSNYDASWQAESGGAPLNSPSFTGNVTITTNSSSPALKVTQSGTGSVLVLEDQASDTTTTFIDANGKFSTVTSTSSSSGFKLTPGTAPSSPVDGDCWSHTSFGIQFRMAGVTQTIANQNWVYSNFVQQYMLNGLTYLSVGYQSSSFTAPSNNAFTNVDSSGNNYIVATLPWSTAGSKLVFRQVGSDPIVFQSAQAFQNKTASAGVNAIVNAYFDGSGWYLEGDLGYVPSGYVYSASCVSSSGYDASGNYFTGSWIHRTVIADGSGGQTTNDAPNSGGCWYPSGWVVYMGDPYNHQYVSWTVYDSQYTQVASGQSAYYYQYDYYVSDGNGSNTSNSSAWSASYYHEFSTGQYYDYNYNQNYNYWVYSDGSSGYFVNTSMA